MRVHKYVCASLIYQSQLQSLVAFLMSKGTKQVVRVFSLAKLQKIVVFLRCKDTKQVVRVLQILNPVNRYYCYIIRLVLFIIYDIFFILHR